MNIHEYQAKELFRSFGIPVPSGITAQDAKSTAQAAESLGGKVVVKAQIYAGGRGKAGGVKVAETPETAAEIASSLLGKPLVTKQTGPEGRIVRTVLVERCQPVARELYVAVTLDRAIGCPVLMVSPDGGMDIEAVASETPERILRIPGDPTSGLCDFEARKAAAFLGFTGKDLHKCGRVLQSLFKLYLELDASLAEINPLVVTADGGILALDAKINIEDNALFRHPDLADLTDPNEQDPLDLQAKHNGLSYIRLDGNIGCMVNGAGLAMATMDLIKQAGGEPANFLDVGGGASAEKIATGFRIILSDPNVKAILINIFGGILRCDLLANGIVTAARLTGVTVPVIVRMQGTNSEEGRKVLAESGLKFTVAEDLREAARLVSEVSHS